MHIVSHLWYPVFADANIFPAAWFPFFDAIEHGTIGTAVRDSIWAFAAIEAVHLLALAIIGGAVLLVDLRLLGWGLKRQSISQVARDAEPWLIGSLLTMIATGWPLMASLAASKYYVNFAFQLKMVFLVLAILFTFTIQRSIVRRDDSAINPAVAKIVAIVSVLLWSGVGIMGRGIGFY
jgi:hypothetical protein